MSESKKRSTTRPRKPGSSRPTEPPAAAKPEKRSPRAAAKPAPPAKAGATRKPAAASRPAAAAEPASLPEPAPVAEAGSSAGPAEAAASPARRRRVVVTGAAGFIGRAVVRQLHERGDQVVGIVRSAARAGAISGLVAEGLELVEDDLSDVARLTEVLRDADALIHAAGSYRVGIRREERGAMWDANVGATTAVFDAAEAAGVARIVYISTLNVYGNTRGEVVDETYRRDLAEDFLSWYDETKYGAHEVAEQRTRGGAPIVIVVPSFAYGPGDPSDFGGQLRLASEGRLRYRVLDDLGVGLVHVDDLATGILAALDRGGVGQAYVLSGPRTRLRDAIALAAATTGHRAPALRLPTGLLRALAPLGRFRGRANVAEMIAAGAGVTYWASAAKAERELGFRPRDLETGFREVFGGPPASPAAGTD